MDFLFHRPDNSLYKSLRIGTGTRINRDKIARQVYRVNMIKSRVDGYSVGQIATAYKVSSRTAWNTVKHLTIKPTFFKYSNMVKLYLRSNLTLKWIRWRIRHKNGSLDEILQGIEADTKPP